MRFFSSLLTGAALIGAALAQSKTVFFTDTPTSVTAGTPVTLKFTAPNGPVTITLRQGASSNLQNVQVITTSATGGSFVWTPDKTLSNAANYAFEITQGAEDNFSQPFALSGGSNAPNAVASGSAAASTGTTGATVTQTVRNASASAATPTGTPTTPSPSARATDSSSTRAAASRTAAASSSTAAPSNAASMNSHSPVALIFGAIAAMAYLN